MTNDDFKAWCDKHGLTIEQAGIVLGFSRANAYKYANGSYEVNKVIINSCEVFDLLSVKNQRQVIRKRLAGNTADKEPQ